MGGPDDKIQLDDLCLALGLTRKDMGLETHDLTVTQARELVQLLRALERQAADIQRHARRRKPSQKDQLLH